MVRLKPSRESGSPIARIEGEFADGEVILLDGPAGLGSRSVDLIRRAVEIALDAWDRFGVVQIDASANAPLACSAR